LAFTASLAFYSMIPWLSFLPDFVGEILVLGLWSAPAIFFLAAIYPAPLLVQLEERFNVLRIFVLVAISFACSLGSLFLVMGLMLLLSRLAGVPLRVV
jgi:hypothetical protein